ncbi:MAG TPA: CHAT domain-containing protein [Jatrophihabitans sp.]|nr:CHAT domain-containing protein [Jatrophihabitans sp.]
MDDPSELPVMALSRPAAALQIAESVLETATDRSERSYARQARGIALREIGDVRSAVAQLRIALRDASALGKARQADVEASLGGTLAFAGRIGEALAMLDSARAKARGAEGARIGVRRGALLRLAGQSDKATIELRAAARVLGAAKDPIWEARALVNLAEALTDLNRTKEADHALIRAEKLQTAADLPFEAAMARQIRGLVAALEGRIPDALAHYDVAERDYATAGARPADLSEARAATLLAAGLFRDAARSAQEAVALLRRPGASPSYLAHALVRAAAAALAVGDADAARSAGDEALQLFIRQHRERGAIQARFVIAQARRARGERSRRLLHVLRDVAGAAGQRRMPEAVAANLLAGEVALDIGDREAAKLHLGRARRARSSRSNLARILGWQAAALSARAAGRPSRVYAACEEGLRALETHQLTLGAIETRAAATTLGRPLANMGLATAVESGDPSAMLHWTERQRATLFRLPPVRLADDPELAGLLAQLRLARLRLDEAEQSGGSTQALEREITNLEQAVRRRSLRTAAGADESSGSGSADTELGELFDALGTLRLVELFVLDDELHALVVTADSDIRHHVVGPYSAALRSAEYIGFALRRLWRRASVGRARELLPPLSAALQRDVLGPAVVDLADAPAVIVPPASLSSIPWGLLPALHPRSFSVTPSAATWLAARRARPPTRGRVLAVAGPRLRHAEAEVEKVAQLRPGTSVLRPGSADSQSVLKALDGVTLAHVAAHGRFRGDNPMFSSFVLDDGPLTVFDLQKLRRAPYRLVLSSCDTGTLSVTGADEVLGLASALIPLGTAGLLAPTIAVVDEAAVAFAMLVHERLADGGSTADALRDARIASNDDAAAFAIAHSFTAFGAA